MRKLACANHCDEAGRLKLFHVVRERGGADIHRFTNGFTRQTFFALAEPLEDFIAPRVGESFCDQMDLFFCELNPVRHNLPWPGDRFMPLDPAYAG